MTKQISLKLDGQSYSQDCELGQTLAQFLQAVGLPLVPEFVQSRKGCTLPTQFTLVHLLQETEFRTLEAVDEVPVPALTVEQVLPTTAQTA